MYLLDPLTLDHSATSEGVYSLDLDLIYIKPVLKFLGYAEPSMHVYMTEASMSACSMGVRGPGCLSCLVGRHLSMYMDLSVTHLGMIYFVCIHLSFYTSAGMSVCLVSFVARKPRTTCQLGR